MNSNSEQIEAAIEEGRKAAVQFGGERATNPHDPETDIGSAWEDGFAEGDRETHDRGLTLLAMGAAIAGGYNMHPAAFGEIAMGIMRSNGQAMAAIFLGAQLYHQERGKRWSAFLHNVGARNLFEIAAHAAQGEPLPERHQANEHAISAYRAAKRIRDCFTATGKDQVTVDAPKLMWALAHGNKPMPAISPIITPSQHKNGG